MINKLTAEQEQALIEYRAAAFRAATSTEPADRPRAEATVRKLTRIAGVKVDGVVWVLTPQAGAAECASLRASLSDSLRASLSDSLWASLSDSLWASLRASLRASLWASLSDSLSDSLWASLWASLSDSLWASLWDSGWLAFYGYGARLVEYAPEAAEKLRLHQEIAGACFAMWIMPGTVILCERPATVEIVNGKLVGLTWRTDV